MAGREAGIDRVAVKARMVALQKEIELRRTVEGLGEWWSEHFDTPFRLLGAVPTDAPERLAELGPAVLEAARAAATPTVMSERDPQLVVPFEELWRGVAEVVTKLPEPGAEVTLVVREGDVLAALRMTGHQFRASAEVWLTSEAGLHVLLFADGTVLGLERDREYAPDGAPGDHVALWRGLPGTRS
ncbi:hypothetical protein ACIA8O_30910 [Kitasatospora sp. NPDC051853]|uniref:hypothetical protein n=1 Tax=Kitasatospora sp. NPDC051853 TaxID=3364058 RepID=UPI00379634A5